MLLMQAFLSISKVIVGVVILLALISLAGCSNFYYLIQAGKGQLALFNHARPIEDVLKDPHTPPRIHSLLGEIAPIKKFGEAHGLKPTVNYKEYVKLDRNAAVWVVSACEQFRFKSKEWRFPVVGSFPFLGWFDEEDAQKFASELRKEGWDVDVRGASAYSTLGWFRDSVLSTMIPEGQQACGDLVNVVLHESVHATLYIPGHSYLNESLANFVADRLTLTYLDEKKGPQSDEKRAYIESEERGKKIEKRLHEAYQQLSSLYSSARTDQEKLQEKKQLLDQLKSDLKLRRDINNATLIQYQTYHSGMDDFDVLLKKCGGDWTRFFAALHQLSNQSQPLPSGTGNQDDIHTLLKPLIEGGC